MSRLQPHFDKVVICEHHFPWYRHDFIDNTVDPDVSNFRLSRPKMAGPRSEEHTSEIQSLAYLVFRLFLLKKKKRKIISDKQRRMVFLCECGPWNLSSPR